MNRLLIGAILWISIVGMGTTAWALGFSGGITTAASGGMIGTQQWDDGGASLEWVVDDTINPGFWTYSYAWSGNIKELSHIIIELSSDFKTDHIISATPTADVDPDAPKTYGPGPGNPGIPDNLFGIKWDTSVDTASYNFEIVSDRAPMWGDFYAVDGQKSGEEVYAYNANFGNDTTFPIGDGNAGGWVLVPDTAPATPIPEPTTMLLLGTGLVGLAGAARRKFKRL